MRMPSIRSSTLGNAIALVLLVLALLLVLADEGSGAPVRSTVPITTQVQVHSWADAGPATAHTNASLVAGLPVRIVDAPFEFNVLSDTGIPASNLATSAG